MITLRNKHSDAYKGYTLLKRKSDALQFRYRQITEELEQASLGLTQLLQQAHVGLFEATLAMGGQNANHQIIQSIQGNPTLKVCVENESVGGVTLTKLVPIISEDSTDHSTNNSTQDSSTTTLQPAEWAGLGRGGAQLQKCKEEFSNLLSSLVKLASLQLAHCTLDRIIQLTNRRVNALEHVLLPKIEHSIQYVSEELDEQEREEFYRLKQVQSKKCVE